MMREKTNIWGQTFISTQKGYWRRKNGITIIEKDSELGSGWWVSQPKEGFIGVFKTLKEALTLKWD